MEDELVEFHFEADVVTAAPCRCRASPRQRRMFVTALAVSLLAHGTLIGAAAIVLRRHSAAVEAARKATFEPATFDGQPTVAHVTIPYRFVLRPTARG
jgi:hypothetical protein